jgi:ribosomal 50S subunit-recycling heat shock protein
MLVIVPASLLGQTEPGQTGAAAILHTQGGVWINGYEARDASAVFPGDLVETKPGSSASLSLDGSTVLIQPESVAKLGTNLLELDHGTVSVGTSKSFKVQVNCITVVPVLNEWTQYEVNNLNGNVQVAARKDDVNVERNSNHTKPSAETQASRGTTVHETEQKGFDESEICGAPASPMGASTGLPTKWIAVGAAAGGGVLLCVLLCGGGKKAPLSSSTP